MPKSRHDRSTSRRAQLSFTALLLGAALSTGCPDPHDHEPQPEVDSGTNPIKEDSGTGEQDAAVEEDAGTEEDASVPMDAGEEDAGEPDGGDTWPTPPVLRNPVDMPDMELATAALTLMGSSDVNSSGSCRSCHALGRSTLSRWNNMTKKSAEWCLSDTALTSADKIDEILYCISLDKKSSVFSPETLGIYSAAAHLPWFSFAFEHRTGAGKNWQATHEDFVATAGMPRSGAKLTQQQFDVVAEWFTRGIPHYKDIVPADPGTGECVASTDPKLLAHLETMKTSGWRAKHKQNGLLMHGCTGDEAATDCLSELPLARDTAYGASWEVTGSSIRVLRDNSATPTLYWSRTSADGRYMAAGGGGNKLGAQVVDLKRGAVIPMTGSYDSGFFPDNTGFMIQSGSGPYVCEQTLLSSEPAKITGEEPECQVFNTDQIGIYQQVGRSVSGSDYWVAAADFSADDGGFTVTLENPSAAFAADSQATLTPMLNNGTKFTAGTPTTLAVPNQGDVVLSPSGELLVTRVMGEEVETPDGWFEATQAGYTVHKITTSHTQSGISASLEPVARVCVEGGKVMLSFDERFMVLHHYVEKEDAQELGFTGPDDPAFAPFLEEGGSNLYLVDLLTNTTKRITNVKPGQYALYPHFRADGWIYFIVRTTGQQEYFAASDAALRAE